LDILLASGEGQFVEFKSCYDRSRRGGVKKRPLKLVAKDVAICLAEFANADGGTLLLGVENDGTVTGCAFSLGELQVVQKMVRDSWKRSVPFQEEAVHHVNGDIIVFEVDPQADIFTLTDGRTPYRNNESTVWFPVEMVRELKRAKAGTLVERSLTQFTINDLDLSLLQRFRSSIGAPPSQRDEDVLIEYDLAARNGSGIMLTMAACLLFGRPPMTRFHERCGVNLRRFDGTVALTGARNNERIDITKEAPLPLLIEQIFQLVQTQIGVSRKLRDLFFEERPEYPRFAWQESIVNAIAHRDYSLRGSETEIRIFDDRLEIKNPGLPPEPVKIEELQQRKAVHASRNPRIMRVLKALGYVRERGEGLPRVFEETEESFLPPPELIAEGSFFKLVLRNNPVFDEQTMMWLRGFPLEKINIRQRRILAYSYQSGKRYFALRDYSQQNKIDKETARKEIRDLLDRGIIEVIGNRKAAKYYPLLQRGTIEDRLKEYFSRHESLSNRDYRRLAGDIHIVTASVQLRALVRDGLLTKTGSGRGTRYFPTRELLKAK